jgi:short-subunit dehydrogenase
MFRNVKLTLVCPGLIQTGMFQGVSMTMKHVTPPLETEEVSDAMISSLEKGISEDVKLPTYAYFIGLVARGFPIEVADWLREFLNANNEMKGFQGSKSEKKED